MRIKARQIPTLTFQILSMPHDDAVILELLDENDDAVMEVNIDSDGNHHLVFYQSTEHVSIPLSELEKAIATAKEQVVLVEPDSLFDE